MYGLVKYAIEVVNLRGVAITSGLRATVLTAAGADATVYSSSNKAAFTNPVTETAFDALGNGLIEFWSATYSGLTLDIVDSLGGHAVATLTPGVNSVVFDAQRSSQTVLLGANISAGAELVDDSGVFVDYPNPITIDGADLVAGDVLHIMGTVLCADFHSTEELNVKVLLGTEAILTTGDQVIAADDDTISFDLWVTINAIGSSGKLMVTGSWWSDLDGTVVCYKVAPGGSAKEVTEDISGSVVLKVQGDYASAHADQESYLIDLKCLKFRKGA
jgi:hypothetical protein